MTSKGTNHVAEISAVKQKITHRLNSLFFILIALVQFVYNLVHFKLHNRSVLLGHFFSKLRAYVK